MSASAASTAPAAPSANSAPAPSPGGGQGGPNPSQGGEGPGFNFDEVLHEARQARKETGTLKSAFDRHSETWQKDREVLDRVRKAFSGETEAPKDPHADQISHWEKQIDHYLEQAMELKSRGQSIPLTTNLALESFQANIKFANEIADLKKTIGDLKKGVDTANAPDRPANDMAYQHMENSIQQSLDQLYGAAPEQVGLKRSVYQSVVHLIQADLNELQTKAPHVWDQVRRDNKRLDKIVNDAIKKLVPPRAMKMIEEKDFADTPMNEGQLWATFREAKALFEKDPKRSIALQRQIRQDILELQDKNRRKRR